MDRPDRPPPATLPRPVVTRTVRRGKGAVMLEMRPDCARCGADLPADEGGAFICSLEDTFCAACADDLDERCPACGGELLDRPARVGAVLARHPAAAVRRDAA